MDWKLAMEAERAALMRLVALLLALADLAESAASRSRNVRGLVLWILRPAEALARELVNGAPEQVAVFPRGNSSGEAMRLAEDFRRLAQALHCQIALAFAVDDDAVQDERRLLATGFHKILNLLCFQEPGAIRLVDLNDTS